MPAANVKTVQELASVLSLAIDQVLTEPLGALARARALSLLARAFVEVVSVGDFERRLAELEGKVK